MNDEKTLMYIFNSSFVGGYQRNLLKTLALPVGTGNHFRWTIGQNVPTRYGDESERNLRKQLIGKRVMIVYIDRFSDYKYYPVRLAEISNVQKEGGKLIVFFKVGDYCYCENIDKFNSKLKDILVDERPKLTADNPQTIKDGPYINEAKDITEDDSIVFDYGDNSWKKIIKQISQTEAYSKRESDSYFYFKIDRIFRIKDNLKLIPESKGNRYIYNLDKGERYGMSVTYLFPYEGNLPITSVSYKVSDERKLSLLTINPTISYVMSSDVEFIEFETTSHFHEGSTTIGFISDSNIIFPNVTLDINVRDKNFILKWVTLAIVIVLIQDHLPPEWPETLKTILNIAKYIGGIYLLGLFGQKAL